MFAVLALLIVYSLLTFGAVLPNSWFVVTIVWLAALAGCLVLTAVRRDRLPAPLIITFVLAAALFAAAPPKIAVGFTAALWAWAATAMKGEKPVLRFFHVLLIVGLIEAAIGLMQFFLNPGWIFGYVNLNYRSSGTLINRNHFAGLLEMLMPVALGFAYIMVRHYREMARIYLYVLAGALMGIALLFSGSRMGIFSFLLTIFFLAFLLRMRDSRQGLAGRLAFGLAVLV